MAEPAILHPHAIPVVDRGGGARTIPLVCAEIGATAKCALPVEVMNRLWRAGLGR